MYKLKGESASYGKPYKEVIVDHLIGLGLCITAIAALSQFENDNGQPAPQPTVEIPDPVAVTVD